METETETPQEAAKQWLDTGREAALRLIDNMPTDTKADLKAKTEALEKFVQDDTFYNSVKLDDPNGKQSTKRQHPAIKAAVDRFFAANPDWKETLANMPDEQLRDQWLTNRLSDLKADGKEDAEMTLDGFKACEPTLVDYAAGLDRTDLERRVTLHHMVETKGFNILKAKKEWLDEGLKKYPDVRMAVNTEIGKAAKLTRMSQLDRNVAFVKGATRKIIQKQEEQTRGARV